MFNREVKREILVVPIERDQINLVSNKEVDAAVAALATHPGFRYLVAKLSAQRNYLEWQLASKQHDDLKSVYHLQAGIHWAGWLEKQVKQHQPKESPHAATPDEFSAISQIQHDLEVVGQ